MTNMNYATARSVPSMNVRDRKGIRCARADLDRRSCAQTHSEPQRFSSSQGRSAKRGLLEALSRDGFCFIESDGSAHVLGGLLSELSRFFSSADHQEKGYLKAYRHGILRGYFPPVDPASRTLELRKERYVFGNHSNLFPGNHPLLKYAYDTLFANHVKAIADVVYRASTPISRRRVVTGLPISASSF